MFNLLVYVLVKLTVKMIPEFFYVVVRIDLAPRL